MFVNDLLNLKDRKLYLNINGHKTPMSIQFYIADNIIFFDTNETLEEVNTLESLRHVLESEAEEDPCWSEDIYQAPMDKIGNCEIRFPKDLDNDVINDSIFDNCYTIVKPEITMDEIIINLK